jgi:hypothetical protein
MPPLPIVAGIWYGPRLSATDSGMRLNQLSLPDQRSGVVLSAKVTQIRSAVRAPGHCVLRRGQGCRPFPRTPFSASGIFLRCAPDRFLLTKPNTSCTIEMPASLLSDGVRDHPRMPFGFLPE